MKVFMGIVFLLGITICTTNLDHLFDDNPKSNAQHAEKGPNSDASLSISTTTSSPVVKKQEDQTANKSDAQSKSKNTVPPRIEDTKSPEDNQTLGMQQEETVTVEQSSNIYKQTEATDKILMGQEPQDAKGTEFPKTKSVIKQGESAVWHEQITKNKFVTEHDLPQVKKTPSCSMLWPVCSGKHFDDTLNEVAKDLMTFTLDLFQKLSPLDSRPNLVVSPISVALALSHLMLGANGKTKDDMLNALYKGVKAVHCIPEAMQNLTTDGPFLSASEIFYNKELHINKEFIDQSSKFYGSKSVPLFKDKKQSLEKINSWVSQRTKGLIPTLLQELPPDLQLILVNVIHYQGKWLSQFDPSLTKNEKFHRSSSDSVKVPTMNAHKYPLQILKDTYLQAQEDLSQEVAVECGSQEEEGVSGSQEVGSGSQEGGRRRSLTVSQVPPLRLPYKRARRVGEVGESALRLIRDASASLHATPTYEEAFGSLVATKMKDIEAEQRSMCEGVILKVLNKGMAGGMTPLTHVCDSDHAPPPPPPSATPPAPQRGRKRTRKTRE